MAASSRPVTVVLGTRPEAIKLAPVVIELRRRGIDTFLLSTGQHQEMAGAALALFDLAPDEDLALMRQHANLSQLLGLVITEVARVFTRLHPRSVIVQGDTSTTLGAALAAFHARIPIAHVEAGLRSHDLGMPFPEELNRRATSAAAHWHFAPTARAAENLAAEGVTTGITITGNTVVDAVRHISAGQPDLPADLAGVLGSGPYIVATAHRRESWKGGIESICLAIRQVLDELPDHRVVFATHPNPRAREPVIRVLGDHPRVSLVEPIGYGSFLRLLAGARLIISDSGGIQEEGPTLGVPVLVTRDVTERAEGIEAGAVRLVGTRRERITAEAIAILRDPVLHAQMAGAGRLAYGDGEASRRIVEVLEADG